MDRICNKFFHHVLELTTYIVFPLIFSNLVKFIKKIHIFLTFKLKLLLIFEFFSK